MVIFISAGKARSLLQHNDAGMGDLDEDPYGVSSHRGASPQTFALKSEEAPNLPSHDSDAVWSQSKHKDDPQQDSGIVNNKASPVLSPGIAAGLTNIYQVLSVDSGNYYRQLISVQNFTETGANLKMAIKNRI